MTDVYVEAADAYEEFRRTGRAECIRHAAAALCSGLDRLERDDPVWRGFQSVSRAPLRDRKRVFQVLEDIDTLLSFEAEVLEPEHPLLEVTREHFFARGRMAAACRTWFDESSAAQLKEAVSSARRSACRRASWGHKDPASRRVAPSVKRGLRVTGGIAIAGANATEAVHTRGQDWATATASVVAGVGMALDGL